MYSRTFLSVLVEDTVCMYSRTQFSVLSEEDTVCVYSRPQFSVS